MFRSIPTRRSVALRSACCVASVLLAALPVSGFAAGSEISSRDLDRLVEERASHRRACGPICVWHVLNILGIAADLNSVLNDASMTQDGVSLSEMARLLRVRGLQPKIVEVPDKDLALLPTPAIVVIHGTHAAVFHGYNRAGLAVCFEPASGEIREIPLQTLRSEWSGEAVVLRSPPIGRTTTFVTRCAAFMCFLFSVAYVVSRRWPGWFGREFRVAVRDGWTGHRRVEWR